MISYDQLYAEIRNFRTVITPCAGSPYPWKHFPNVFVYGESPMRGIQCGCGRTFHGWSHEAATDQPAPELWSAFEKFKAHIAEVAQ